MTTLMARRPEAPGKRLPPFDAERLRARERSRQRRTFRFMVICVVLILNLAIAFGYKQRRARKTCIERGFDAAEVTFTESYCVRWSAGGRERYRIY